MDLLHELLKVKIPLHPMNARTLLLLACGTAITGHAAVLVAPTSTFNWTATDAWVGPATWNSATPDSATFGAITGTVVANINVDGVVAQDITFTNALGSTWQVRADAAPAAPRTLTLSGTLTVNGAGLVELGGGGGGTNVVSLAGPGAVVVDSGELRLTSNANTFSGGITLNGGILRVGNGNGTGTPQTVGSLGTGTLTINGGTIHQQQGNGRTQNVNVVIGGNFALTAAPGGGLNVGATAGSASVQLGNAQRAISVSQNADGTGASALLGLQNLQAGPGGSILKTGEGVLAIDGTAYTGAITATGGEVRINTGSIGTTDFDFGIGTVLRKQASGANSVAATATVTLDGAALVLRDTSGNGREEAFQTLQIGSGGARIDTGTRLILNSDGSSAAGSGIQVRSGGVLGGAGLIEVGTSSISAGVTSFGALGGASVILGTGATAVGSIRPGTPDVLDATIATLSLGSLTWNGGAVDGTVAQMAMNLGASDSSDLLSLSGSLTKGTGSSFVFDFLNYNATGSSLFTLLEFGSFVGFTASDFSAIGITYEPGLSGQFLLNAESLQFQVVPEPAAVGALLGAAALGLVVLRRRR